MWLSAVVFVLGAAAFWLQRSDDVEPTGGAVRVLRGGAEVELSGPLSLEMAATLRRVGAATLVQLDSVGGSRAGAQAVAAAIRAAGQDTAVTDRCFSVCVAAFAAGRRRWVGPFAQIGLDRESVPLYREAHLPDAFLREATLTPPGQAWFPTVAQTVEAALATGQAAPDQFALAGFGPAPTPASIRQRLLTVPLYRAVSIADPAGFDAIASLWVTAVIEGQPGTAAFQRMQQLLARSFTAALPLAPDRLLLAHGALFRDELAWMLQHNEALCSTWAATRGGLPGPTDEQLASRRREIELAVLQAVNPVPATPMADGQTDCLTLLGRWKPDMPASEIRLLLNST